MINALLAAAAQRPLSPYDAAALGTAALDARREEDAIAAVSAAAARSSGEAVIWHVLGLLHRAVGDLAPAIEALDRAVALAPADPKLVHARARAAAEAGLPSIDWYVRARSLAPNDGDVILGHAAALLADRDPSAADRTLAGMLRLHPGWLPGHAALLRLRHANGDPAWLGILDAAIASAPRDGRLHHLKASVLLRKRDDAATDAALSAAQAACGDDPALLALAAMAATEQGRLADADAAFARVDVARDAGTMVHWLRHLLRRGEPERVAALYGALPAHSINSTWPYLSIAWRQTGDARVEWLDDDRLVRVVDLDVAGPTLAALAGTLRALHVTRAQPVDQSVRGGTQTDGPLLSRIDPAIVGLRQKLIQAVRDYIAALPSADAAHPLLGRTPRHPRFAGSWSVRLTGGGHHAPHVHTEGWISSAFYVNLPPPTGDQSGWLTLGAPPAGLGASLPPTRIIQPVSGRLVLFPATMWHATTPFPDGERLTVAFDIA